MEDKQSFFPLDMSDERSLHYYSTFQRVLYIKSSLHRHVLHQELPTLLLPLLSEVFTPNPPTYTSMRRKGKGVQSMVEGKEGEGNMPQEVGCSIALKASIECMDMRR
jgi:hypothetical protein